MEKTEEKKKSRRIKYCYTFILLLLVIYPAYAHETDGDIDEDCNATYKHYDEVHMAYSKDFADKYDLSDDHIEEMPEYLQFIEMIIRSEFGEPACYLNFAIDNRPDIFKIPDQNFHLERMNSQILRKAIRKEISSNKVSSLREIYKKTMWQRIGYFFGSDKDKWRTTVTPLPTDLFVNKSTVVSFSKIGCQAYSSTAFEYLLFEKTSSDTTPLYLSNITEKRESILLAYEALRIPEVLKNRLNLWNDIVGHKNEKKICKHTQQGD